MVLGLGVDLLSIPRFEAALRRHPRLLERVFTAAERRACERKRRPLGSYAARFAAKEAAMKALGTGWGRGVGWQRNQSHATRMDAQCASPICAATG